MQLQESRWEPRTALDHVNRSKLQQGVTAAQQLGCGNRPQRQLSYAASTEQRKQSAEPAGSRTPEKPPAASTYPILDSYSEHICSSRPQAQNTTISQLRCLTLHSPKVHQGKNTYRHQNLFAAGVQHRVL